MRPLEYHIEQLDKLAQQIEQMLNANVMAIVGPIITPLETYVRDNLESIEFKRHSIAILLDTPGGVVEVVERMVRCIRHFYKEVFFMIPDCAMSAGTVFALSGDRIFMDYFSCLGPIDPQIWKEKDQKLVPAFSYLKAYEELVKKSEEGRLTTPELMLIDKLDLGELHQFEHAGTLTNELIIDWLCNYKFKNWLETEKRKIQVTPEMRRQRAQEIAIALCDYVKWHSHRRGIGIDTLKNDLKLKIENFSEIGKGFNILIRDYLDLMKDYKDRLGLFSFVHTFKGVQDGQGNQKGGSLGEESLN